MHGVMKKHYFVRILLFGDFLYPTCLLSWQGAPVVNFPVGTTRQTAVYFHVSDGFPLKPTPSKRGVNFC